MGVWCDENNGWYYQSGDEHVGPFPTEQAVHAARARAKRQRRGGEASKRPNHAVAAKRDDLPPPKTGRIYPSDPNCICVYYGDNDSCRYPKGSNCPWCHCNNEGCGHDRACPYEYEQPLLPEERERMELERRATMWKQLFFVVLAIAAVVILSQAIG